MTRINKPHMPDRIISDPMRKLTCVSSDVW